MAKEKFYTIKRDFVLSIEAMVKLLESRGTFKVCNRSADVQNFIRPVDDTKEYMYGWQYVLTLNPQRPLEYLFDLPGFTHVVEQLYDGAHPKYDRAICVTKIERRIIQPYLKSPEY